MAERAGSAAALSGEISEIMTCSLKPDQGTPNLQIASPGAATKRQRSKHGIGKFVTDLELCEYLGVPPDTARPVLAMLDRDPRSGFPQKQKVWGDRRYLPSVNQWLENQYGLKISASVNRMERHG